MPAAADAIGIKTLGNAKSLYYIYNITLHLSLNSINITTKKNLYIVYRLNRSSIAINNLR